MTAKLLPLVTEHHTYVEPFGGGASLLLAKPPSLVEVYNDLDEGLYSFFRVLADPDLFPQLMRRVDILPYSRRLYGECCATWAGQDDPVERAWRWFVVARQSFSGRLGEGWSFAVTASYRGMAGSVSTWLSCLAMLPAIHERLSRVQVECHDWRQILETYDTPRTFFYLDPPYVAETRRGGGYQHEMTTDDHRDLVERLLALQGKVLLSGYAHQVYAPLEKAGWERRSFRTACYAAGRTRGTGIQGDGAATRLQPRTETAWRNPAALVSAQTRMVLEAADAAMI